MSDPSVVFVLNEITGLGLVLHKTPLAIILAPPSDVTFPPLLAVVVVMDVAAVVVANTGKFPLRPLNWAKLICENPSKESSIKNNM